MQKCFYCSNKTDAMKTITVKKETLSCCDDECSARTLAFIGFTERAKVFFITGLVVSTVMILSLTFSVMFSALTGIILFCGGWALLGLTICIFPFATPQTFQWLGIRKTVILTRLVGILIIVTTPIWAIIIWRG